MIFDALLGERRCDRIESLLQGARDLEGIGAELRRGLDENAGLSGDQSVAEARLGAFAYRGEIAEAHGQAVARADHRGPERLDRGAGGLRLDHDPLRRSLEIASADERRRALRRLEHIVEREAGGGQLHRIHLDLPLAHLAAEDLRLGHTRNRENLRLHAPLHDVAQLQRRQPVARVAEVHQVLHRGAQRREQRRADTRRQEAGGFGEPLGDDLALAVRVAAAVEHHLHGGQSLARGGAHGFHVFRTREQILQRTGDQRLDLRCIEAGRLGLHQHVRRREVRKHVEARGEERGEADERDQTGERRNDARSPQRGANDCGQHASGVLAPSPHRRRPPDGRRLPRATRGPPYRAPRYHRRHRRPAPASRRRTARAASP